MDSTACVFNGQKYSSVIYFLDMTYVLFSYRYMHIYFLKLNVLDTPGQSVWNQVWWKKNTRQGESLFCKHILAGEDIVYYFSFQVYFAVC